MKRLETRIIELDPSALCIVTRILFIGQQEVPQITINLSKMLFSHLHDTWERRPGATALVKASNLLKHLISA